MGSLRIIVSLVLVLLFISSAHAEDISVAKEHYDRGTTLYDLQRYAEAAREYEAAYEAKHDPALLFNIGQAYRFAGDSARAIGAFKSFLRRVLKTPNRVEVEARIDEMQKLLDAQRKSQVQPPAGTLPTVEKLDDARPVTPSGTKPAPIAEPIAPPSTTPPPVSTSIDRPNGRTKIISGAVVAAVGLGLVAAGGAFAALGQQSFDEINSPKPGYVFQPGAATGVGGSKICCLP